MDKIEIMLEEYKALQDRIIQQKKSRDTVITATLIAYFSVYGLFGKAISESENVQQTDGLIISAITSLYLLHLASVILMKSYQQHLSRIIRYLREEIENSIDGLNWHLYRKNKAPEHTVKGGVAGIAWFYILLTSLPLGIYYIKDYGNIMLAIYVNIFMLFSVYITLLIFVMSFVILEAGETKNERFQYN